MKAIRDTPFRHLQIPLFGHSSMPLFSLAALLLGTGYERVLRTDQGLWVEFSDRQICLENLIVPRVEEWRLAATTVCSVELRSVCPSSVRACLQKRQSPEAEYRVGRYYISALDLRREDGGLVVGPAAHSVLKHSPIQTRLFG